jgi:hypothetical protein
VHSLLLFGWVEGWLPRLPRHPAAQLILLAPPSGSPLQYELRYEGAERSSGQRGAKGLAEGPSARNRRPNRQPSPAEVAPPPQVAQADTGAGAPPRRPPLIGRIGPGLADGRLWVRPLPLPPKELAERLSKSHVALVDSAVTAIIQAYLDSIAAEPASRNAALPSWTTEVAGKKFGLDSKNIYIAGLKIPAAVLALLPIPAGNIDQNRAYSHLMDMRADLQYAAQRSANLAEFKEMIREMRERKEREREFERNQRTAPAPADTSDGVVTR